MFPQHSLGTGGHAEMIERLKILKTKNIAKRLKLKVNSKSNASESKT